MSFSVRTGEMPLRAAHRAQVAQAAPRSARSRPRAARMRDRAVEAPAAVFKDELVDRADAVGRCRSRRWAFAPGFEVLVDVARNADDSSLGGDGERMGSGDSGRSRARVLRPAARRR